MTPASQEYDDHAAPPDRRHSGCSDRDGPAPRRWMVRSAAILCIAGLDQLTKALANAAISPGEEIAVLPGFLSLVNIRNTGAAWGMFQRAPLPLALISISVLLYVLLRFDALAEDSRIREIALILLCAGILGNLIDRVVRRAVVDFILVYYRSFHWPAFNAADSAITCGVLLYVASSLFQSRTDS